MSDKQVEILPSPEASDAGCSAECSIIDTVEGLTYYRLTASPAAHWELDYLEWNFSSTKDGDAPDPGRYTNSTSPCPIEGRRESALSEGRYETADGWYTNVIHSLYAHFKRITFWIDTSFTPRRSGSVTGGGEYQEGSTCTLKATPNQGYVFVFWERDSDHAMRFSAEFSFEVTQYERWVAHFEIDSGDSSSESSSEDSSEDSSEEPPYPPGPDSSDESSEEWEDGPLLYNPKTGHLRYNTLTNHLRYKRTRVSD